LYHFESFLHCTGVGRAVRRGIITRDFGSGGKR
jgi:hypothetical protein